MIAILVAVKQELHPILRCMRSVRVIRQEHLDFYEGLLGGVPVAVLALGVGKECARIAAEITIRTYHPDIIISAGFGGGLVDYVQDGDIIIGTEIVELQDNHQSSYLWQRRGKLYPVPDIDKQSMGFNIHRGKIVTSNEMVLEAEDKFRLGKETRAIAVDMETCAVAAVVANYNTELVAVRCITDNDHESLPEQFNDFFVLGQLQPMRVFSACSRDPRLLFGLARLGYRARSAGKNLAYFLELLVLRLPQRALALHV